MSNAKTTLGMQWQIGDGNVSPGPEVFNAVAEVTSGNAPGIASNVIDVTTHNNNTGFEEVIVSALKRMAEITFKINFIPTETTHDHLTGVMYIAKNSQKRNMKVITSPQSGSRTFAFAGYITNFQPDEMGTDMALTATVTVKPTDYLTIT